MASAILTSASEYLRTAYEHDAEFVDGYIEKRPAGEKDHGLLQRKLLLLLSEEPTEAFFTCIPEMRIQVSETRFRVPDLALISIDASDEQIAHTPPILCIEILSPEDTMSRTLVRVRDFLRMGVPQVWVFDPETRTVLVAAGSSTASHSEGRLKVPHTPIEISLADVFVAIKQR